MNASRYLLIFILSLLLQDVNAQLHRCSATHRHHQHLDHNPELQIAKEEFLKLVQQRKSDHQKSNEVVVLPVVVHVIFNTNAQNIDSLQIASQLDVLNEDFRKLNENINIVEGGFVDLAADIQLEFRLVDRDPSGNPTNGITRSFTTNPAIGGNDFDYFDESKGGVKAWDPTRYINIWCVNINSAGGDLGFAKFPSDGAIDGDGMVIDYKYFGTTGTAAASQPWHLGRTGTHEMGHYLGLFHIWGDEDDCMGSDEIDDTPVQETSSFGCPSYPFFDTCTPNGDGINFFNYMDFTDDECMAMFTIGQKEVMRSVLSIPRSQGGRSELVQFFSSTTVAEEEMIFNIYPNPVSDELTIQLDGSLERQVELFDISGRKVYERRIFSPNLIVDTSILNDGLYLVKVTSGKTIETRKFVVHR